jgi:hypothetical protein
MVDPSKNVTLPPAGGGDTIAVSVIDWLSVAEAGIARSVIEVVAGTESASTITVAARNKKTLDNLFII